MTHTQNLYTRFPYSCVFSVSQHYLVPELSVHRFIHSFNHFSLTLQCHSIFSLRCQLIWEALSHGTYIIRRSTLVHSLVFVCSHFCYITHCSVVPRPWSEARHGRQTKCIFKLAGEQIRSKGNDCVIVPSFG